MIDIDSYMLWLTLSIHRPIEMELNPYAALRDDPSEGKETTMVRNSAGQLVCTEYEQSLRQFELDIDLKIIRAAKRSEILSYIALQDERERVLGSRLNIKCQPAYLNPMSTSCGHLGNL